MRGSSPTASSWLSIPQADVLEPYLRSVRLLCFLVPAQVSGGATVDDLRCRAVAGRQDVAGRRSGRVLHPASHRERTRYRPETTTGPVVSLARTSAPVYEPQSG